MGGGASEEKKGGVPNRVRASERSCSNPSEKKAANFISGYFNARLTQIQTGDAVIRVAKNLNQKPASVPVNTAKQGVGEKGIADDTKPKLYKHKIDIRMKDAKTDECHAVSNAIHR